VIAIDIDGAVLPYWRYRFGTASVAVMKILLVLLLALAGCATGNPAPVSQTTVPQTTTTSSPAEDPALAQLRTLESRFGARIGLSATNTATGKTLSYRQDERFAIASTFKGYAAAALLHSHPLNTGYFNQVIHFSKADLVDNSPVTSTKVATGMTVAELCEAAITKSDNTAGNQLLKLLGGPEKLTEFARSTGDQVTRLDRWETDLNSAVPGDVRDTTSPQALGGAYRQFVVGDLLKAPEREQLKTWLLANTTGGERIRAGLPSSWKVADKTGSGRYASLNDVAIAWTDTGAPIVISVLTSKPAEDAKGDNAVLAETAKVVVQALAS
jgi:beta-lactamase class A